MCCLVNGSRKLHGLGHDPIQFLLFRYWREESLRTRSRGFLILWDFYVRTFYIWYSYFLSVLLLWYSFSVKFGKGDFRYTIKESVEMLRDLLLTHKHTHVHGICGDHLLVLLRSSIHLWHLYFLFLFDVFDVFRSEVKGIRIKNYGWALSASL